MIDLTKNEEKIKQNVQHCRERKIKLPTFSQMQNPDLVPDEIKNNLKKISLWETDPNNLFRITWKNEPVSKGGGYGNVNYMVIPSELSGVRANIIALTGNGLKEIKAASKNIVTPSKTINSLDELN